MTDATTTAPTPEPQPVPNDGGTVSAAAGDVVAVAVESGGLLLDLVGGLFSLFR